MNLISFYASSFCVHEMYSIGYVNSVVLAGITIYACCEFLLLLSFPMCLSTNAMGFEVNTVQFMVVN